MQVEVRVFGGLEGYLPGVKFGQPVKVELKEGATAGELADVLGIPRGEIFTLLVNGMHRNFDWQLKDGDRVSLFPAVGGG